MNKFVIETFTHLNRDKVKSDKVFEESLGEFLINKDILPLVNCILTANGIHGQSIIV